MIAPVGIALTTIAALWVARPYISSFSHRISEVAYSAFSSLSSYFSQANSSQPNPKPESVSGPTKTLPRQRSEETPPPSEPVTPREKTPSDTPSPESPVQDGVQDEEGQGPDFWPTERLKTFQSSGTGLVRGLSKYIKSWHYRPKNDDMFDSFVGLPIHKIHTPEKATLKCPLKQIAFSEDLEAQVATVNDLKARWIGD